MQLPSSLPRSQPTTEAGGWDSDWPQAGEESTLAHRSVRHFFEAWALESRALLRRPAAFIGKQLHRSHLRIMSRWSCGSTPQVTRRLSFDTWRSFVANERRRVRLVGRLRSLLQRRRLLWALDTWHFRSSPLGPERSSFLMILFRPLLTASFHKAALVSSARPSASSSARSSPPRFTRWLSWSSFRVGPQRNRSGRSCRLHALPGLVVSCFVHLVQS